MKNTKGKKEFYENDWYRVLPFLVMEVCILPFVINRINFLLIDIIVIILPFIASYIFFQKKIPYIIVDSTTICYKDKFFGLECRNVLMNWSKIKKITLMYGPSIETIAVHNGHLKLVLKLDLNDGQIDYIRLSCISDKVRRSLLDAIKYHKKIEYQNIKYESNEIFWQNFCVCTLLVVLFLLNLILFIRNYNSF